MPTTLTSLAGQHGLLLQGPVRWGSVPRCDRPGVYLVSRTSDPALLPSPAAAPLSHAAVAAWLELVPKLTLDGISPSTEDVIARLEQFWLADEAVLYIGKADVPLKQRVGQFYRHTLGKRSPHRGGHWLKTLDNLPGLFVFYATVDEPSRVEASLLLQFSTGVSESASSRLWDPGRPIPFANLRRYDGTSKNHGFAAQTQ